MTGALLEAQILQLNPVYEDTCTHPGIPRIMLCLLEALVPTLVPLAHTYQAHRKDGWMGFYRNAELNRGQGTLYTGPRLSAFLG